MLDACRVGRSVDRTAVVVSDFRILSAVGVLASVVLSSSYRAVISCLVGSLQPEPFFPFWMRVPHAWKFVLRHCWFGGLKQLGSTFVSHFRERCLLQRGASRCVVDTIDPVRPSRVRCSASVSCPLFWHGCRHPHCTHSESRMSLSLPPPVLSCPNLHPPENSLLRWKRDPAVFSATPRERHRRGRLDEAGVSGGRVGYGNWGTVHRRVWRPMLIQRCEERKGVRPGQVGGIGPTSRLGKRITGQPEGVKWRRDPFARAKNREKLLVSSNSFMSDWLFLWSSWPRRDARA